MKEKIKKLWEVIPVKVKYLSFFVLGFCLCFIVLWFSSCTTIKSAIKAYPNDNPIEELVEDVIELKTGIDIDLTPSSPESKIEE